MKTKTLIFIATAILLASSTIHAIQGSPKAGNFNIDNDLLLAHYDCKTDVDDLQSVAALATLLSVPKYSKIKYHAVAGAYGMQEGLYVPANDLFQLVFKDNWTDAHENLKDAIERVKLIAKETLADQGDIWIAEAGQSDFSAELIKAIQSDLPDLNISKHIHVVQHADWNEEVTTLEKLKFVKQNTDYIKIPDGNVVGNGTPGFRSPDYTYWKDKITNPKLIEIWQLAIDLSNTFNGKDGRYNNEAIAAGGLDFSDLSEVCWILGLQDIKDTEHFFNHYSNTFRQDKVKPQSGFINAHPEDHLPSYIKLACGFGERPDWSHDGRFILFLDKPMGEVYELELATGTIRPKTRHFNHYGFTRAMYLSNGDILLSGPNAPFNPTDYEQREKARDHCWLSVMDKSGEKKPVPLNTLCAEGPAVSRNRMRIAWTHRDRQIPELGKNRAKLLMAEIVYEDGIPILKDERVIFDSKQLPFSLGNSSLETQNFVPPEDIKITFAVYTIDNGNNTDVYMLNSESGEYQAITNSPCCYDEPEGIFPDGSYTCVEHANSKQTAWPLIDLYKLKLDGSGEMQRLTYFTDYKGFKANQGVVSDDGKYLCFQIGKANQEAGVGFGFFIMDLEEAAKHLEDFKTYNE